MANKELVKEKETGTALALMSDMEADAGAGFENVSTKDISIPYISLAQATSDRVKRGPGKVEGLEEGDFLNTATMEIFKSGTFRVIPCGFKKVWVERTGLGKDAQTVASHDDESIEVGCTKDEKGKMLLPNGNFLVPTAMHFVFVVKPDGTFQAGVISLSNSQLRRSKDWMAIQNALKIKTASGLKRAPTFSHSYAVTSAQKSNAEGSWMVWTFSGPEMLTNADMYQAAKAFYLEVQKGAVKVAEPPKDDAAPSAESEHF